MYKGLADIRAELMNRNARHLTTFEKADGANIEIWSAGGRIVYLHEYADEHGYDVAYPCTSQRNDEVLQELQNYLERA